MMIIATAGQLTVSNPLFVHNSTIVHASADTMAIRKLLKIDKPPRIISTVNTASVEKYGGFYIGIDEINIAIDPSILL